MLTIGTPWPRCNDIHFLLNKGGKPSTVKIESKRIAYKYPDIGIIVLKPIIDRIIFGFTPTPDFLKQFDPGTDISEYLSVIKANAVGDAKSNEDGLSYLEGVPFKKPPYSNYNVNLRFQPDGVSDHVIIQIDPKKPSHPYIKIDLNPNRIDQAGMASFRKRFMSLLITEAMHFKYVDVLRWSKIYRTDVAIDILGVRPCDLEIFHMVNGKPSPEKSHQYESKTGRPETIYPQVKPGKSSTEYVYDRRQKQLDKGWTPDFRDFLHSRYECRMGQTTFYKLMNAKNRAVRISINALDIRGLWKMKTEHVLFTRYALDRNLEKVLELVPLQLQPEYKAIFKSNTYEIWQPKKIWAGWEDGLRHSGLFDDAEELLKSVHSSAKKPKS